MQTVKRTGSRKTLTAANLVALGGEHLAAILMDAAEDDPSLKRRLRLELAGAAGPEHLVNEISKRLVALEGRRSRVHRRGYKGFVRDLDLQRAMILGPLAEQDPGLALEALWRLLRLAASVFPLIDDARGQVQQVFRAAVAEVGGLILRAPSEPLALADQIAGLIEDDVDGVLGDLVAAVAPSLNPEGLTALRARLEASLVTRAWRRPRLRAGVQILADAQRDVQGYVATLSEAEARQPSWGAEIARRLLGAGQVEEALAALTRAAPPEGGHGLGPGWEAWEEVYIAALEADGQNDLAQQIRWRAFEKRLSPERLRAFLRRLSDFDDVEAEARAMALARGFPRFSDALAFLTAWPAAADAAELVLSRREEIEPAKFALAEAAAAALERRHPLAASLLLRVVVSDTLRWRRVERAADAERQIEELTALSARIEMWGEIESHAAFMARMLQISRL